jgi:predicted DCC family thiol-disulfide oxidoreductase YuxK
MNKEQNKNIVLFDGYCNLCSWSVQFIIKNDPKGIYQFGSLQSEEIVGQNWPDLANNDNFKTIILIEKGKTFFRSTAALKIARRLSFPLNLLSIFIIIPAFLRDPVYNWIARNRFRWFGKRDVCFVVGDDRKAPEEPHLNPSS